MTDSSASIESSSGLAVPRVTLMPGDGIGPEVVAATRRVLDAAGVRIEWEECVAGARAFASGIVTGVPEETLDSVARTGVVLKGPLETPVGHGGKSANVTLRKLFEVYGNIRPARELPGVQTPFSGRGIDLVVVRENVEDLYAGIEHMQTPDVAQCLKLMSRRGCEMIVRLAFEVAAAEGRSTVHCATKANIMKLTEGLLKRTFEDVAREYPQIDARHVIIDNCAHQLVINPEQFEVIVTSNMNGDIISDLTSGLVGGLGVAPSASIGARTAIFEPVHGSAPDIAGQDRANPVAMLLTSVHMLRHLGQGAAAKVVEDAVLAALEDGSVLTGDLARQRPGATVTGTTGFADAVIERLGSGPSTGRSARESRQVDLGAVVVAERPHREHLLVGMDVFLEHRGDAAGLGRALEHAVEGTRVRLKVITNRGTVVYPQAAGHVETVDQWCARFVRRSKPGDLMDADVTDVLHRVATVCPWMHVEKLQRFDDEVSYSRAQGES